MFTVLTMHTHEMGHGMHNTAALSGGAVFTWWSGHALLHHTQARQCKQHCGGWLPRTCRRENTPTALPPPTPRKTAHTHGHATRVASALASGVR